MGSCKSIFRMEVHRWLVLLSLLCAARGLHISPGDNLANTVVSAAEDLYKKAYQEEKARLLAEKEAATASAGPVAAGTAETSKAEAKEAKDKADNEVKKVEEDTKNAAAETVKTMEKKEKDTKEE